MPSGSYVTLNANGQIAFSANNAASTISIDTNGLPAGTYAATCSVTADSGNIASATNNFIINTPPTFTVNGILGLQLALIPVPFTISPADPLELGDALSLTYTGADPDTGDYVAQFGCNITGVGNTFWSFNATNPVFAPGAVGPQAIEIDSLAWGASSPTSISGGSVALGQMTETRTAIIPVPPGGFQGSASALSLLCWGIDTRGASTNSTITPSIFFNNPPIVQLDQASLNLLPKHDGDSSPTITFSAVSGVDTTSVFIAHDPDIGSNIAFKTAIPAASFYMITTAVTALTTGALMVNGGNVYFEPLVAALVLTTVSLTVQSQYPWFKYNSACT